jgi:hypothetical protein
MFSTDKLNDMRRRLVAAGIQTVAFTFDGMGDSGSVEEFLLPPGQPTGPLDEYEDLDVFDPPKIYNYQEQAAVKSPGFAWVEPHLGPNDVDMLKDLAYAALENFDGDWVNNDGGYGRVAIDLLTGQYRIDGYQRYMSEEAVCSSGEQFAPLDDVQLAPLNVTDLIKRTLEA